MSLQLPPVSISLLADVSKLTAGVRQAEQIINQAAAQTRPMQIRVDGAGATREVTALIAQLRTLTNEMRAQEAANGQQRTSIAALVAQHAALRAQLAQGVEQLRINGASAKEMAAAHGNLRAALLVSTAAIAAQRSELASGVNAQGQYRAAIASTREQLKLLEGDAGRASAAQKAANTATSSNRAAAGGGGGDSFRSTLLGGAVFGVGAMAGREVFSLVTAGAGAAKEAIIGFNSSMEQSKIAFATFLGGAQQANTFLAQLQQFAIATPFEFPQLVEAAKRMMAYGFAAQQVIPLLTAVGNVSAGLGAGADGVDRITLALGQMQSKGTVVGNDLRQLQDVGVNTTEIMALIGKETGQTTAQVKKLAEDGKLSATTFIGAFQEWSKQRFGDMMEKQSHTFKGAMSNIHDAAVKVLSQMGAPLFGAISRAANAIADFSQSAQFQRWAAAATAAVQQVISFLGQLLSMAGTVAGALGFSMPKIDMAKPDDATFQSQEVSASGVATAQAEAARQAAGYAAEVTEAEGHLKEINAQLNGVKDQQDAITNQIADIKQGYADQIDPLERQIAAINRLSDAERARAVRRNELEGQEIQVKLSMPDVSGIDESLQQLNRDKQDLGKFDSSQWDTALAGLHDQLNQISHEDTKTLDHAMQAVQESLYQLGRENTKALDSQIAGLQKNIADLGKHATDGLDAQIQSLHDKIDGLSTVAIDDLDRQAKALKERVAGISTASIDAIDAQVQGLRDKIDAISTASIDALDAQLAGLQERLKGFNTDDLDRQIAHLQAKMNEPVADTSGMTNQLTLLASQLGGPGDEAARQQFAGLSAQKAGILSAQQLRQNAFKQQLASLEAERTAQKLANDDAKATIQNQIDGIEAQKKGLVDLNTERRKGWETEIKALELAKRGEVERNAATKAGLESQIKSIEERKQGLVDANTEAKKGWESQIKGLEATKKGVEERIAGQKEAMQAQLEGLQATKKGIDDERANRRDALQDQLHGMQETKRLADEDRAARRQGIQEQIDGITKEKDAAKAVFDQNIAAIDANIRALTRQKEDALAPYNAALARIGKEKEIIGLLDQQDALSRKIAEAPLKERIEALKLAEQAALDPLERQQKVLERQTRELEGQKRQWDEIKQKATDAGKAMVPPDPTVGTKGLPDTGAEGFIGPVEKTGLAAEIARLQAWLEEHRQQIVEAFTAILTAIKDIVLWTLDHWPLLVVVLATIFVLTNPLAALVILIIALVAAFETLYKTNPQFKKFVDDTVQGLKDINAWVDDRLVPALKNWYEKSSDWYARAGEHAQAHAKEVGQGFLDIADKIGQIIEKFRDWYEKVSGWYARMGEHAQAHVREVKQGFQDLADKIGETKDWIRDRFADIGGFFDTLGATIHTWVTDRRTDLQSGIDKVGDFKQWVSDRWDDVTSTFDALGRTIGSWVTDRRDDLQSGMDKVADFKNWVSDRWDDVTNTFSGLGGTISGWVSDRRDDLQSGMDKVEDFQRWIGDRWNDVTTSFTDLGTTITGWKTNAINDLIDVKNWITQHWSDIGDLIAAPFTAAIGKIGDFFSKLGGGIKWLADHFKLPDIAPFDINAVPGHATGIVDSPEGHVAVVGERGPEIMFVPQHSTIVPNDLSKAMGLLPGHAEGFNLGFLGDALGAIGNKLKGAGAGLVGKLMDGIGVPDLSAVIPDLGKALVNQVKDGLLNWIKGSSEDRGPVSSGGAGGAGIAGSGELIAAILAATSDTAEQTAMLFGAFIESGGQNIAQRGGGPGRGYFQIEAGEGGQYAGQVDPYDARAAARFMEADYRAAMRYYDGHDLMGSLAQVVFHAERPASFYGNDQIANAWAAIQPFLVKGGGIVGTGETSGSGQFVNPVPGRRALQGSWTHGGTHDREAAVDWDAPYGTLIHAVDSGRAYTVWNGDGATGNTGIIDHGNGWITYYGHVSDFGEGGFNRDSIVGHTGSPEQNGGAGSGAHLHFAMRLNGAYERPEDNIPGIFGLANGGFFPANMPNLAVIGEGAHPEIASPVPIMKQSVKDAITELGRESGLPSRASARPASNADNGNVTVVFETGAITVDKDDRVVVNKQPITLRQARIEAGIAG